MIGAGPLALSGAEAGINGHCRILHGLRACIEAFSDSGSDGNPLTLVLYRPGHHALAIVDIGLAGTGAIPRTVLDSIRPR